MNLTVFFRALFFSASTTMSISRICFSLVAAMIGLATVTATLQAEDDKVDGRPGEFKLTTERVVVFKDGYFLIIKRGFTTTDEKMQAFTEEVPDAAVLGSFWAVAKTGEIQSMTAGWRDNEAEETKAVLCTETIEILEANVGAECSFMIDKDTKLSGVIKKVLTRETSVGLAEDIRRELNIEQVLQSHARGAEPAHVVRTITQSTGASFILGTDEGDVLLRADQVSQLRIAGMKTELQRTIVEKSRSKRLTMKFDKPNQKVEVVFMYFRPGVRWIPTYRVDLNEDIKAHKVAKKDGDEKVKDDKPTLPVAELTLQGEIINEAEDLIDMPIDLVVGVPNFRFRDVPSPLVLEGVLRNTLVEAAPQLMGQQLGNNAFSNAIYTQRSGEVRSNRASGQGGAAVQTPKELSSDSGNDLFVYHLPKMTLKKGERASAPIMTSKVRYRDIYTWDIQLKHSEVYAASGAASASPLVLSENKVWRQVELINDTNFPWTTGAAMFVNGFQPLAQELLTYTSSGGICRVPVTVAVDLRGKVVDVETDRKLNEMKWQGYSYAKVLGQIDVELANNKTEPVPVEVRLRFGGKADEASEDGKIRLEMFHKEDWVNYRSDTAVNNSTVITWTSTIEPEECFKPIVKYHFFTRH